MCGAERRSYQYRRACPQAARPLRAPCVYVERPCAHSIQARGPPSALRWCRYPRRRRLVAQAAPVRGESPAARLPHATAAPGLRSPPPHLHRDWAHPCHSCTGTGLTPATSAQCTHRSLSQPCHICLDNWFAAAPSRIGTGLAAATSAPGLGLAAATSAPGPGSPLPRLRRDRARRCHVCAGTGLASRSTRRRAAHLRERRGTLRD